MSLYLRLIIIAVVSTALCAAYWTVGDRLLLRGGSAPFVIYFVFFCLILPLRLAAMGLGLGICLFVALFSANEAKIALTRLPLSILDIRIFASTPIEALNALRAPEWLFAVLVASTAIVAIVLGATTIRAAYRISSSPGPRLSWPRLATMLVAGISFVTFLNAYDRAVSRHVENVEYDAWEPEGATKLSRTLGLLGFMAYAYHSDKGNTLSLTSGEISPADEINKASEAFVTTRKRSSDAIPNIALVLVESTFDPNEVFNLATRVSSPLFEPNPHTQAVGLLYVNAIGGGSWISEFEVFTGVDSRLFGLSGYYTHASLSPFVNNSLVHYLKARDYRTLAFYGVGGAFYNARNAFKKYGFDAFYDKRDLDLMAPGWSATDEDILRAVVAKARRELRDGPSFFYISLLENHSPHACRNFGTVEDFQTTFTAPAGFLENCILNEYVRVLSSTARGFDSLVAFLVEQERLTGRPFVVLAFGDHQPHTFTSGGNVKGLNFTRFRRRLDPRYTYFHLMSSLPGVARCCDQVVPHITLLPTLLSGFVASGLDDLYLPENFLALKRCGKDPLKASAPSLVLTSKAYGSKSDLDAYDRHADTKFAQESKAGCTVLPTLVRAYEKRKLFVKGLMQLEK
jgi:hypothetical protein